MANSASGSASKWKGSFYGDLHVHGTDGIEFYIREKMFISRWYSPGPETAGGAGAPPPISDTRDRSPLCGQPCVWPATPRVRERQGASETRQDLTGRRRS